MAGRKKDRLKSAQAFINALSKSNEAKAKTNVKDEDTTVIAVPEKHGFKKRKIWIGIGIMAVAVVLIGLELISSNYITVNGKIYKQLPQKTITVNGVSFDMIWVGAGTFTMGADTACRYDVKPAHIVTLTKNYYIGKTEVTQALWEAVMGQNPSRFKGASKPVHNISWNDCRLFLSKLNTLTGLNFRLPTEAEWEYAARGGNRSCNYDYSGSDNFNEVAWKIRCSSTGVHAVAIKKPNELGIYDMSGSVAEWCSDWYDKNYYERSPQIDPAGPDNGENRVWREGVVSECSLTFRSCGLPDEPYWLCGLRLVLDE